MTFQALLCRSNHRILTLPPSLKEQCTMIGRSARVFQEVKVKVKDLVWVNKINRVSIAYNYDESDVHGDEQ